jgi:hypothetical protein
VVPSITTTTETATTTLCPGASPDRRAVALAVPHGLHDVGELHGPSLQSHARQTATSTQCGASEHHETVLTG